MKQLRNVPADKVFYVFEGGHINSIYQLADTLSSISAKSFNHHVSSLRNDFANWVRDVIQDSELAPVLAALKTRTHMEKAVRERIKELEAQSLPAHSSTNLLKSGVVDFVIGLIVGAVAGLIIASLL